MRNVKPSDLDAKALRVAITVAESFAGPLPSTTISRAIVAYLNACNEPHPFEGVVYGTADRGCTRSDCGLPDRHPIHDVESEVVTTHVQVGWYGPYGIIPGGMNVDPNPAWEPIYIIRKVRVSEGRMEWSRGDDMV